MQHSSSGCRVAQEVASELSKVQCSLVGCSLAQWKDISPWRPEFGPEGKHVVSGNSLFFKIFGEAAKLRWTGARSARLACFLAQKDGCAQRTGAHARPKPTSCIIDS